MNVLVFLTSKHVDLYCIHSNCSYRVFAATLLALHRVATLFVVVLLSDLKRKWSTKQKTWHVARTRLANLHTHIAKLPRVDTRQQGRRRNRSSSIRISHCQLPVMREATHAPPLQKLRSRKATVRLAIIMHRPERVRKTEHKSKWWRRREGGGGYCTSIYPVYNLQWA